MKNFGGSCCWKYLLISRIIFYFKNNLLKSRIRIDDIIFYFFVIYLHVTPHLIGRLLRTDDMFSPSSPPVSWRQSVLPYLLEQTFKRWGENNHAVKKYNLLSSVIYCQTPALYFFFKVVFPKIKFMRQTIVYRHNDLWFFRLIVCIYVNMLHNLNT